MKPGAVHVAIGLVKIARDAAIKAYTTAIITLKGVLVVADHDLRDRLEPLTDHKLVSARMLITAGDNSSRVPNEAAFARMCGVAPIPTSHARPAGDVGSTGVGTAKQAPRSTGP